MWRQNQNSSGDPCSHKSVIMEVNIFKRSSLFHRSGSERFDPPTAVLDPDCFWPFITIFNHIFLMSEEIYLENET